MYSADQISELNELELAVYNFVLQNYKKVLYMRIRDLASEVNVSTTTILRFCKKLGFDGFTEFRYDLKSKVRAIQERPNLSNFDNNDLRIFLDKTTNSEFKNKIDEASKTIMLSNNIIFVGIGNSGIIASFGARYFTELLRYATYFCDPFVQLHREYDENTVIVAISATGESVQTINIIQRFKLSGAKIVCITNSSNSTLAKLSNHCIDYNITSQKDILSYTKAVSQVENVYLIEMIAHNCSKYL